jgi:hypothetical protein
VKLLLVPALALLSLAACGDGDELAQVDVALIGAGRPFFDPDAAKNATQQSPSTSAPAAETSELPETPTAPGDPTSDDPLVKYGWTRDRDGYIQLTYLDLVLDGLDQELLVEKLLYPDDYKDVELTWPARVRALDGQKVALTGYMLPILWKDTTVPHFMLVRDLMACCFGGAPLPDEWTDVKMDGEGAGYWSYVPVITRGIFRLAGIADEAGYAAGAYSIEGHDVRREL